MLSERFGILKDGIEVYDRHRSHVADDEALKHDIREALLHIDVDINEAVKAYTHDFGKPVGEKVVVPTEVGDEIVYARRRNHKGLSRFVKGKKADPTSRVTVVLMKNTEDIEPSYVLITGFYGDITAKEPWDKYAEPDSKDFWDTHAFVWGKHKIVPGSATDECPW